MLDGGQLRHIRLPVPTSVRTDPVDLRRRLGAVTLRDERRLRRRLAQAERIDDREERHAALAALATAVDQAERHVARRRAAAPAAFTYPPSLPITERRAELLRSIRDNQVVVVAGETGSGKSTQLPKLCLELGRGVRGMIGHTQPRRLAARTVAERVADEVGSPLGDVVGYTVRFSDQVGERTLVRLMTDGILLAELQHDRALRRYDTIIVDEAHERSLNIDFILGYLTELLPRRPDLRVVVTSATIDTERFAQHFGAPVVEVSGRSFPVETRYRPIDGDAPGRGGRRAGGGRAGMAPDEIDAITAAVDELCRAGPGDILVFLSGEREIRDTAAALAEVDRPGTEVLPLFARLSAAEQHRVFRPHDGRRIVLATNVAETSITVPGVRYVVDLGTARISRYNRRTKVQRLPIEPISRASADQRAGRCGRVAPGICIRLWDEDDHAVRPEFTDPEILRTNLASVVLQMAALGLGDIESFPFVDRPDARAIRDAVALLVELGAMTTDRALTPLGRRLARLPVDPRFGRMILEADAHGCVHEVLVIAAALSIQDPRERPLGQEQEADALHARFVDPASDVMTVLNLWAHLQDAQRRLTASRFRRTCRAEHLHHARVREWQDLVRQLREAAGELGIRRTRQPAGRDAVHRSVLAGLLSHVGMRVAETSEYLGARQARFSISPGSALHGSTPTWVMAGELVETDRLRARMVARIDPGWIEPLAGHLVRRSHGEPWWDPGRGVALTNERVSLYGLPIVPSRHVSLDRVDPAAARAMFIHHALVAGDWTTHHDFARENGRLLDGVAALEERARRRDLLVSDERLAEILAERIGDEVTSAPSFDAWWSRASRRARERLTLTLDDVVAAGAEPVDPDAFPTRWRQGNLVLDVSYTFGPGEPDDGVTVHVPLPVLFRLSGNGFDWQVPGHRLELVTALIRSLPKQVRRNLVPAPDRAREALAAITPGDGPLLEVLAGRLSTIAGVPISPASFDLARVPPHLLVRFRVEDGAGGEVASSRDLAALQRLLRDRARRAVTDAAGSIERTGMRGWDLDTLPRTVGAVAGGHAVRGFPALVDEGATLGVRVLVDEAEQASAMAGGARRLLMMAAPGARREVERRLRSVPELATVPAGIPGPDTLADDCLAAAADRIVTTHGGPPWDAAGARRLEEAARARLGRLAVGAAAEAAELVVAAHGLDRRLAATTAPTLQPAVGDMRAQVAALVTPGFVTSVGLERLRDLRRYLEGVRLRLAKLGERPQRDRAAMQRVHRLEAAYDELRKSLPPGRRDDPEVADLRWMLEELRISLFAQVLGTARPVSEKRLRRAIARVHGT
ncbi:MAG TPA: ATP-dependent RNA helicase HrpA [Acidimicrobiales bacterium]